MLGLNAEQEALLEQLELSEDISIKDIIDRLYSLKIEDKEPFNKSFNQEILKSTIECLEKVV